MSNFVKFLLLFSILVSSVNCESNEIIERPSSWMKSAQEVLAGPAGHMVVQVAKELINRSAGNSQVLSLNLTNLLVIILLKILIFAAGMLGAGHWGQYARGRNVNSDSWFAEGEAYLFTGFLTSQGSGNDGCLYRAACISPTTGYEYARAAKAVLNGIQKFEINTFNHARYKELIEVVEKGAYDGYKGTPCNLTYRCDQ